MSPGITWRNGGPLMVGGLVGGSDRCCCETPPPPPEGCTCPDFCAYQIEIVQPSVVASRSGFVCNQQTVNEPIRVYGPTPIDGVLNSLGGELCGALSPFVPCSSYGQADVFMWGPYHELVAQVAFQTQMAFQDYPQNVSVYVIISVRVSCLSAGRGSINPETGEPYGVFAYIYTRVLVSGGNIQSQAYYRAWDSYKEVDISRGYCERAGAQSCEWVSDFNRVKKIDTPVTFSVSPATTSFGDYDGTRDLGSSSNPPPQEVLDAIDALSDLATFRITSRPACNNIPADCGVPIEGRTVYFPKNSVAVYDFIVGTPSSNVFDFGAWEFEHPVGGLGTVANPYLFNARKYAEIPAGFILEEYNLELFCASDDTVSPPVSRWYVRETVHCSPDYSTLTTDQWISEIPSYPEPAREVPCGSVNAGDPVPVGEPSYERVDGYPITSYGDGCVPPPPIGLQITDLCS